MEPVLDTALLLEGWSDERRQGLADRILGTLPGSDMGYERKGLVHSETSLAGPLPATGWGARTSLVRLAGLEKGFE